METDVIDGYGPFSYLSSTYVLVFTSNYILKLEVATFELLSLPLLEPLLQLWSEVLLPVSGLSLVHEGPSSILRLHLRLLKFLQDKI